jgi:hypothetical protein
MKSMKLKPKKKAAGSAKSKNATPAKKKTLPAKAANKNEKPADPRETFIRDGIVTKELRLEWEKTKDLDPVADLDGKFPGPVISEKMEDDLYSRP